MFTALRSLEHVYTFKWTCWCNSVWGLWPQTNKALRNWWEVVSFSAASLWCDMKSQSLYIIYTTHLFRSITSHDSRGWEVRRCIAYLIQTKIMKPVPRSMVSECTEQRCEAGGDWHEDWPDTTPDNITAFSRSQLEGSLWPAGLPQYLLTLPTDSCNKLYHCDFMIPLI